MKYRKKNFCCLLLTCIFYLLQSHAIAQSDSIPKNESDSSKNKSRFFNMVMKNLRTDTTAVKKANSLTRNDLPYKKYEGRIIKNIVIKVLPFGTPITDTTKKVVTTFTSLANTIHHKTRTAVIKNNLFFRENDVLKPYLMADNETYLRQLPYLLDASFLVLPIDSNSVNILVIVKDLFSLGGAVKSLGLRNTDIEVRENNLAGSGNGIVLHGLYDISRKKNFGDGIEYIQENIGGSFITADVGYQSYYPGIKGLKEENMYFARLIKPLENRYTHWTYEFDASYHSTRNMYSSDSVYYSDIRYRFYNFDAWAGYNINSNGFTPQAEDKKLRKLVALRVIKQEFQDKPSLYDNVYYWRYFNLQGVLGSFSFYRQNFYKSQYVYGFGKNEDIPEGLNLSLTAGYTKKENLTRPFIGINYQRSAFNSKNNYFSYTLRGEGYVRDKDIEDINLLGEIDYFDHLKSIGTKWKQRTFITIGIAKQINTILNEPLYLDGQFGLPEFRNGDTGGNLRATIKAQSVFFSPWSLASFRFAPFIFGNTGLFSPFNNSISDGKIYTTLGGGIRTRNESLIFGTLEFKGYYFLQKNIYHENYRFDISTNLTFKSNTQLVRKPDFIQVN